MNLITETLGKNRSLLHLKIEWSPDALRGVHASVSGAIRSLLQTPRTLQHLELVDFRFTDDEEDLISCQSFVEGVIEAASVREITLQSCHFCDSAAKLLEDALIKSPAVSRLSLSRTSLGSGDNNNTATRSVLGYVLIRGALTHLRLNLQRLPNDEVELFAEALKQSPSLTHLSLDYLTGDNLFQAFDQCLPCLTDLRELRLNLSFGTNDDNAGRRYRLLSALKRNSSLESVQVLPDSFFGDSAEADRANIQEYCRSIAGLRQ